MTPERREALARAHHAVDKLRAEPSVSSAAADLLSIVTDRAREDGEAWEAVHDLEHALLTLGLATVDEIDATRQRLAYRALAGEW